MLSVEKQRETHIISNEGKEKLSGDYDDTEIAMATKRVQKAQTAIMQEQEHMRNVENARSTTTHPETTLEQMMNAIGDSLSDHSSSADQEDGEDEDDDDDDTELGKLSDNDEPGWVMGTISKTVQHRMESFRQQQMMRDELTQPGLRDMADHLRERDMKYGTTELKVLADVKPQTDMTAATPSPSTFGDLMHILDIVPGQSQMLQVTSRQGSCQIKRSLEKPQAENLMVSHMPEPMPDSSQMEIPKTVQSVSFHPSM